MTYSSPGDRERGLGRGTLLAFGERGAILSRLRTSGVVSSKKEQKYFRLSVKQTERSILEDESCPRLFIEIIHHVDRRMAPFMRLH